MNKEELRIGNLVNDEDGIIQPITAIIPNFLQFGNIVCHEEKIMGLHSNIETIRGIPISEEWLVKLGFEKHDGGFFNIYQKSIKMVSSIGLTEDRKLTCNENGNKWFLDDSYITMIHEVHQLQNLYYSLTNKELKVK